MLTFHASVTFNKFVPWKYLFSKSKSNCSIPLCLIVFKSSIQTQKAAQIYSSVSQQLNSTLTMMLWIVFEVLFVVYKWENVSASPDTPNQNPHQTVVVHEVTYFSLVYSFTSSQRTGFIIVKLYSSKQSASSIVCFRVKHQVFLPRFSASLSHLFSVSYTLRRLLNRRFKC